MIKSSTNNVDTVKTLIENVKTPPTNCYEITLKI